MVETLSKFGVPLDVTGGRGGILMPKLKYRHRVRVINFGPIAGGLELTQQVITVGMPNVSFTENTIDIYNSKAYYAGKYEWQNLTMSIRDDVTNSVAKLVGHQIQKQLNFFEQTSAAAGINYKFNMILESLDGGNVTVFDQWTLEGCFLTAVNYGDKDYASSDPVTIELTIRYDNATLADGLFTTSPQLIPGIRL